MVKSKLRREPLRRSLLLRTQWGPSIKRPSQMDAIQIERTVMIKTVVSKSHHKHFRALRGEKQAACGEPQGRHSWYEDVAALRLLRVKLSNLFTNFFRCAIDFLKVRSAANVWASHSFEAASVSIALPS
jgi:hypothetical protein